MAEWKEFVTFAVMKSQLLKMDAPYPVIYAGGLVGRHMATLLVWTENEEGSAIASSTSYPVIDMGQEYPAGMLCDTELMDCRVLCPGSGQTNVYAVAKVVEYDQQQLDPAGSSFILRRLRELGCEVKLPMRRTEDGGQVEATDFRVSLDFWPLKGMLEDEGSIIRARSVGRVPFYFEATGTAKEVEADLEVQLSEYLGAFIDQDISIELVSDDGSMQDMVERLNAIRF